MRCRRIIGSATTALPYISYLFQPLLLAGLGGATLRQVAYSVRLYDFLAVLSQPPCRRWITALSVQSAQLFCLCLFVNALLAKNWITQDWPFGRRGCAPIPYHLLSGLGMYAFLLSAAKPTYCTTNLFLLFLSPPARVASVLAYLKGSLNSS